MRHNNIVSAIEWLPEHLFTEEIVEAAVESKEIEVLSHIPGRFLTPGRIERIIAGSTESWHSFELRNIPEAYRSGAVCDYAMRKKPKNITAVPEAMVTREMAEAVIRNGRGDFDILAFIPERLWDAQLAYLALRSYIYDPYYTDSRTDAVMKTGLILGYVPVEVKTQEFYYGMLDGMKILSTVTDAVVPSRFKTAAYYRKMAEHDLSLVPARFYSYEILHAAVCSTEGKNFITDPQFFKPLSVYLDDMLADRLMEKHPYMFGELPKRFKTPERLVIAIDNSKRETNCYIDEETEQSLLSVEVCKAFIRRNGTVPNFLKMYGRGNLSTTAWSTGRVSAGSARCPKSSRAPRTRRRRMITVITISVTLPNGSSLRKWRRSATRSAVMHMPSPDISSRSSADRPDCPRSSTAGKPRCCR